jgi:hypothetical protein
MPNTEENIELVSARAAALADLQTASRRASRRATAIGCDLQRIAEARAVAANAAWLIVAATKAARGSAQIEGTDWSTGEPVAIRVAIDPSRSPREQLEAMFRHAKRLTGGEAIACQRRDEALRTRAALLEYARQVETAESAQAIDEALAEARRAAARDMPRRATSPGRRDKRDQSLPPHRTFTSQAGELVLVGRGAARNDALTFQIARPHHLWMHARGVAGAHVIVPIVRGRDCPADLLIDAAHLAAHFSDARGEGVAEIITAPRKWVRKPRGAAPGAVIVEREKVIVLRVEPDRLAGLLSREVIG